MDLSNKYKCILFSILASKYIHGCIQEKGIDSDIFYCPDKQNRSYEIWEYSKEEAICIYCSYSSQKVWNWAILPKTNSFRRCALFRLYDCPLKEGIFKNLFEIFYINPKTIRFHGGSVDGSILRKQHLQNLDSITSLDLFDLGIESVEYDAFEGTKSIEGLSLANNKLLFVPEAIKDLPNLMHLDLASNRIIIINDALKYASKLISISLYDNNINDITEDTFKYNKNLQSIDLAHNNLTTLSPGLINFQFSLRSISMNYNSLKTLENGFFSKNINLETINLVKTDLEQLDEDLFRNCSALTTLYLTSNNISFLPNGLFKDLKKLENLVLLDNQIEIVNASTFSYLTNIKRLNLESNKIRHIHEDAFKKNRNLLELNLRRNRIIFPDGSTHFQNCRKLVTLDLSGNLIDKFDNSWLLLEELKSLVLDENMIQELKITRLATGSSEMLKINLQNNKIKHVDLSGLEEYTIILDNQQDSINKTLKNLFIDMEENPISCDCNNFGLLHYFRRPTNKTYINFDSNQFICKEPEEFRKKKLSELSLQELVCPVNENNICPLNCDCFKRPYDSSFVVNCSERGLDEPPILNKVHLDDFYNQTVVYLDGNHLVSSPREDSGYENVTQLYLSRNQIKVIPWIPPHLEILDLEDNKLSRLNNTTLHFLKNSKILRLSKNEWICDCETLLLSKFLIDQQVLEGDPINCHESTKLIINLLKEDVCEDDTTLYLILGIGTTIFMITIAVLLSIYYKYEQEIKLWLFLCCLYPDPDLDKYKYDAFISYSELDKDFVENILVRRLESGPNPYKLLLHYRSFLPGEPISKQIAESVANSKRTIAVVSPNFVTSVWGKMEFQTAHIKAMEDNRARLIVIIYKDVPDECIFDDLKTYLDTGTYIKWNDSFFWDKLRICLPVPSGEHSTGKEAFELAIF